MNIHLNGDSIEVEAAERISYERIVELAGYRPGSRPSMTFHKRIDRETEKGGILHPGETAPLLEGMSIMAMFTGNA